MVTEEIIGSFKPFSQKTLKKYPFLNIKYAFKVCRIEPENNIDMILEGFSKLNNLPLVMIGNWNLSSFGKRMKIKYKKFKHLYLLESIYSRDLLNEIRSNYKVYVHGHSAGGTNPSLVEAMSLGLPTLCYDINYNIVTTDSSALYFKSSDDLINLIKSTSDKQLKEIG